MHSGFGAFLAIGFFVMLGITLVAVYLTIRLIEAHWPRGTRLGLAHGMRAPMPPSPMPDASAATSQAPVAAPATKPAPADEGRDPEGETTAALRVLELRLANGDIDVADYQTRREALDKAANASDTK